jgi:predicted Mrr-cat superfamily restriction endonuclease
MARNAFALWIKPSRINKIDEALRDDQIIMGWANAKGLLDLNLSKPDFRGIIHQTYYSDDPHFRKAGRATSHLWRLIREMRKGDLVVVPNGKNFYMAEVSDDQAIFLGKKAAEDTSYRRNVRWLSKVSPIPRTSLSRNLQAKLKQLHSTSDDISEHAAELEKLWNGSLGREGDWSERELLLVINDYMEMLRAEISGLSYSKAEHRRILMAKIERGKGSIEFKHQNISAVLEELKRPWIKGYKPRHNYQAALFDLVSQITNLNRAIAREIVVPSLPKDIGTLFVSPPGPAPNKLATRRRKKRLPTKLDYAERDEQNRVLGSAGEAFVFEIEKHRFANNPTLLKRVRWVAKEDGDGAGYDIASVGPSGEDCFIEVKTTRGGIRTPFFLTANEIAAAQEHGTNYRIYRVFNFATKARIFEIQTPLEKSLVLIPSNFTATPK